MGYRHWVNIVCFFIKSAGGGIRTNDYVATSPHAMFLSATPFSFLSEHVKTFIMSN
jgi:hypothetical protein